MFKLYVWHRRESCSCLHFPQYNTNFNYFRLELNRRLHFCDTCDTLLGAVCLTGDIEALTLT